jgi:CDP-diacylglycerol--glycerol-3-phosphate 3-phosphatidyltransferase
MCRTISQLPVAGDARQVFSGKLGVLVWEPKVVTDLVRTWSARVTQPIARFLGSRGWTPNAITVFGFLLTALVAVLLAAGHVQLAGVLLIVALGTDALDGALARMTGMITRFGAFLDSTLDRWAEVLIYGAIVWLSLKTRQDQAVMLATAAMAVSLLVSYTRARAEGVGLKCKEGLFTRFERLAVLIAGLILDRIVISLWIITLLAGFTAVQRIWITWRADQSSD